MCERRHAIHPDPSAGKLFPRAWHGMTCAQAQHDAGASVHISALIIHGISKIGGRLALQYYAARNTVQVIAGISN
jgi:hypothetical protein